MKSNTLCIYIESLRIARHISQEAFLHEIVSIRQYRRYLRGESDIPFSVISQLTARLGLKTDTILREFEVAKIEETEKINSLYNLAVNYDHKKFAELAKTISIEHIIEQSNVLLYKHSIMLNKYYSNKITADQVKKMSMDLINYPTVLQQGVLNTIELLILTFLIDVLPIEEQSKIIDTITLYLNDSKVIVSGGNERVLTLILARLAKHSGILESYDQVIKFCNLAIKRNKTLHSFYIMDYLYYYKSLAYYSLNDQENFEIAITKCFNILEFEGNEIKTKKFINLINEDYNIDFKNYVLDLYVKKRTEGNE
jgi:transcriptional regulator with XRE-family HTH domain